jgi:hypothetical protein
MKSPMGGADDSGIQLRQKIKHDRDELFRKGPLIVALAQFWIDHHEPPEAH